MIRLLGRQTSGNVQKIIFCLEELGVPYGREDYGRQFGNTLTEGYRKLNPTAKVPTLIDGSGSIHPYSVSGAVALVNVKTDDRARAGTLAFSQYTT